MTKDVDLLIIGGGPAGLCAAISGASEGLKVTLLDNGLSLGGQAKESNAIENYPGFPGGVTGEKLMGCFVRQAQDFHSDFVAPTQAVKLIRDSIKINNTTNTNIETLITMTDDYTEFSSKSVLISIGLQYRRLNANGISPLMGRGVYYGAPNAIIADQTPRKIAIIGGANSAGQAAVKLAQNKKNKITMYIRHTIKDLMSTYLIERIEKANNITVCEHCEISEVYGSSSLEMITVDQKDKDNPDITVSSQEEMDCMFIFIGAMPRTLWLDGTLKLSSDRYIPTGYDASIRETVGASPAGVPLLQYETSLKGVFAAGDVRSGSTKRVSVAAGEGASALQNIHKYLSNI